jgi:hypothetical protein
MQEQKGRVLERKVMRKMSGSKKIKLGLAE